MISLFQNKGFSQTEHKKIYKKGVEGYFTRVFISGFYWVINQK